MSTLRPRAPASALALLAGAALGLGACGERNHPPGLASGAAPGDGSVILVSPGSTCVPATAPPSPDAEGLCGNLVLPASGPAPNLYFVLDRSGSMGDEVDGRVKWTAVSTAVVNLVAKIGSHANFGAAVFPDPGAGDDSCAPGVEVFATRPGDVLDDNTCLSGAGSVTRAFSRAIALPSRVAPLGGTPTAATLEALRPSLAALPGKTAVVLATDGGPNCNTTVACDKTHCIPNIEQTCNPSINCCTDAVPPMLDACLDDEATVRAVSALKDAGVQTYVIGIPGSGPYAGVLNALADAGGTARAATPRYYDVKSMTALDDVLSSIGAVALLSCHLDLEQIPPDVYAVNVYFDRKLIEYGPDGWVWSDAGDAGPVDPDASGTDAAAGDADPPDGLPVTRGLKLDLVGASCDTLMSGQVRQVQIVSGCPTEIPR